MPITVNGRLKNVELRTVRYEDVVYLAHGDVGRPNAYTVTWRVRGANRGGTLCPGDSVPIEGDMAFSAQITDSA